MKFRISDSHHQLLDFNERSTNKQLDTGSREEAVKRWGHAEGFVERNQRQLLFSEPSPMIQVVHCGNFDVFVQVRKYGSTTKMTTNSTNETSHMSNG